MSMRSAGSQLVPDLLGRVFWCARRGIGYKLGAYTGSATVCRIVLSYIHRIQLWPHPPQYGPHSVSLWALPVLDFSEIVGRPIEAWVLSDHHGTQSQACWLPLGGMHSMIVARLTERYATRAPPSRLAVTFMIVIGCWGQAHASLRRSQHNRKRIWWAVTAVGVATLYC